MGLISGLHDFFSKTVGADQLKKNAQSIKNIAVDLSTVDKAKREESFENALKRLNLTEADIETRQKEFTRLFRVLSAVLLLLFIYLIYVITKKALIASLGTCGLILVVVAQMFRYHFWLFQIRKRKLGCTFKEWMSELMGKRP